MISAEMYIVLNKNCQLNNLKDRNSNMDKGQLRETASANRWYIAILSLSAFWAFEVNDDGHLTVALDDPGKPARYADDNKDGAAVMWFKPFFPDVSFWHTIKVVPNLLYCFYK